MNLIKLSWKNLIHRPLSLSLSVILFALGVGLITMLFLIQDQLQKNFEKNLAGVDLVIGAKGSPLQLILSSMYHIDAPTGNMSIGELKPFLNPRHPLIASRLPLCLGDSYKGFRVVGTTPSILEWYDASIATGEVWSKHYQVTLGHDVASQLDLQIGDQFRSSHGFADDEGLEHEDALSFEVVGILSPTGSVIDQLILTTVQTFWMIHGHENPEGDANAHDNSGHAMEPKSLLEEGDEEEITSLLIRFKGRNFQALNMQRSINENTDLQAATPAIEINRLFSMMDSGEQALRLLAMIIIIVSGISIFISLYSSLNERKYELALMRVMGAGPKTLFYLILVEGLLVATIGFVIGFVISHTGMEIIGQVMKESYRYNFTGLNFLHEEWFLLIGSLLIGALAGLFPALQAAKTDISKTISKA